MTNVHVSGQHYSAKQNYKRGNERINLIRSSFSRPHETTVEYTDLGRIVLYASENRHGRSMRHEYRGGHSSQHAASDTAKHELAQTRVAVAAHHDEIHVLISRM